MYLTNALILNIIRDLEFTPAFHADRSPKPIFVVGPNGSGKTNLLSIIADGLVEHAKRSFRDIVQPSPYGGTFYFRLIGPSTVSVGATFSATFIRFERNGSPLCFRETQGRIRPSDLSARVGDQYPGLPSWDTDDPQKVVSGESEVAKAAFELGSCCFFPSSRAEQPYWLNVEGMPRGPRFELTERLSGVLRKPFFVERSLEQIAAWILDVILDARIDAQILLQPREEALRLVGPALGRSATLGCILTILRALMNNENVRLICAGREHGGFRLRLLVDNNAVVPSLAHYRVVRRRSFRYSVPSFDADLGDVNSGMMFQRIEGIVLIDEVDAHLHAELQYDVLSRLVALFPRVQFICTTHSPLEFCWE